MPYVLHLFSFHCPTWVRIVADPVIPRGVQTAQLQPVQRRLACQRRAARTPCRELAGEDGEHRVMAQLVMIDAEPVPASAPE